MATAFERERERERREREKREFVSSES